MAAAATLGLPERADAGRDDDYRYVWLRDQAYAQLAAAVHEPHPLLDEAVAFTTARVLEHGDRLAPAYRLDGRVPPHEQDIPLPGYPGGGVRTGNWVADSSSSTDAVSCSSSTRPPPGTTTCAPTTSARSRTWSTSCTAPGTGPTPASGSSTTTGGPIRGWPAWSGCAR
jgi:hypothetical protein